MKHHYINNQDFLEALINYKTACDQANSEGIPQPSIPNYIGECFLKIAEHLSRRPNFVSYSFREEMISDAVENSLNYFRNFDPLKSSNPFAYFTQISYYAFLRRIDNEKKQLYIKYKSTELYGILDESEYLIDEDGHTKQFEIYDNLTEYINEFEEKRRKKKQNKIKGIEKFMEDDNE